MSLAAIIAYLYPDAPHDAWRVQDDSDGTGPKIAHWDAEAIGAPQPTAEEVLSHEDEWRLDTAQTRKIEAIDARSSELLTAGLTVAEGKTISTSDRAQRNLLQLSFGVLAGVATLPQPVSTIDRGEYTIADGADLQRIQNLWHARSTGVLDAGRALRLAVLAAETVEDVEAVQDARR